MSERRRSRAAGAPFATPAGRPLFLPYAMGGYPDPATSAEHAALLARHADVLELGVPFSDPLADGPTIQAAGAAGARRRHAPRDRDRDRRGPGAAARRWSS